VKRTRSNTPLQALTLMNDPVYVEAAMGFARRVLSEQRGAADGLKIEHGFLLATARKPRPAESATLRTLLETERELRRTSARDAQNAADFAANFKLPEGVSAQEFCAWYAVAAAVLNMDETISKQ
jgi:hypothetical protein